MVCGPSSCCGSIVFVRCGALSLNNQFNEIKHGHLLSSAVTCHTQLSPRRQIQPQKYVVAVSNIQINVGVADAVHHSPTNKDTPSDKKLVLIREVSFGRRGHNMHSKYLLPKNCVLCRGVSFLKSVL